MTLSFLFWTTFIIGLISFWWQSDQIKTTALRVVYQYCKQQNLQVLDQNMVLKGVWLIRDESGSLAIRRRYAFEFTSTGEQRYQGQVELLGRRLKHIELQAHILPDEDHRLH